MNPPKFTTLGCRLNAYETEAMKELSQQAGLTDAVIVNTCAVTAEAVRKARQEIRKLRRENPEATLIVTGLSLLMVGAFVESLHDYETHLTVIGAIILASGHVFHWARIGGAADQS